MQSYSKLVSVLVLGTGIASGQYYWVLDIGRLAWYRSNPTQRPCGNTVKFGGDKRWVGKSGALEHKSDNITETRKDRGKVTMEGHQELTNALSNCTIPDPLQPPIPQDWGLQPPPKLQSVLSQEGVKLQTSNLTGTFIGSIQTKAH